MGRPKKIRTPDEEATRLEARRSSKRESARRRRADPEYRAGAAAAKRQRRADDPEFRARESERRRLNDQSRRASDPGYRVMENFQRQARRSMGSANGRSQREFLGTPASVPATAKRGRRADGLLPHAVQNFAKPGRS